MLNGTYTPSHAGTAASGTFTGHLPAAGGGSFAAGGAASFAAGRSPSRVVSMSHAPSLTSRVSEGAQGSFFAGNRCATSTRFAVQQDRRTPDFLALLVRALVRKLRMFLVSVCA